MLLGELKAHVTDMKGEDKDALSQYCFRMLPFSPFFIFLSRIPAGTQEINIYQYLLREDLICLILEHVFYKEVMQSLNVFGSCSSKSF